MPNFTFRRISDDEIIPLSADTAVLAIALLSQREGIKLSETENGKPQYLFAELSHHTAWCRAERPVYLG
jgi:hypothetical protein